MQPTSWLYASTPESSSGGSPALVLGGGVAFGLLLACIIAVRCSPCCGSVRQRIFTVSIAQATGNSTHWPQAEPFGRVRALGQCPKSHLTCRSEDPSPPRRTKSCYPSCRSEAPLPPSPPEPPQATKTSRCRVSNSSIRRSSRGDVEGSERLSGVSVEGIVLEDAKGDHPASPEVQRPVCRRCDDAVMTA